MILGIKVGPDRQSFLDLEQTNAPFAEVWFDVNRADEYMELFAELKRRHMQVGLHFWGIVSDQIMVSFGHPDQNVLDGSRKLVKQTIDIAAREGFAYVNIHPGSRAIVQMDLGHMDYPSISEPVPVEQANKIFLEEMRALDHYAKTKGVVLTVETVCRKVPKTKWYEPSSRLNPIDLHQLPAASVAAAGSVGIAVANDFVHTESHAASENPTDIWTYLSDMTRQMAPQTRLVHLGFMVPPLNGCDTHDSLDNPLLETDQAVPNRRQMIELLKLFANRDDVWILVEPNGRHPENYFLAKKILEDAGVLTPKN
ncbi:TIM barrel protein [Candidatus Gottesmanbacteria bacterium]|nr:TIM barrel protein [Candidatus Gottesmanbacteria bacterium]